MLKKTIALLLILGGVYAGYVYGYNKGFSVGVDLVTKGPTAKLTEKKPAEPVPDLENMKRALTGSWQSVADKKLVRSYTELNEVVDSYANKRISAGEFTLFSSASIKEGEVSFVPEKGRIYISVIDSAKKQEDATSTASVSYFRIDAITPADLRLSTIGKTDTKVINFKRI